jgi:hypothetical protein
LLLALDLAGFAFTVWVLVDLTLTDLTELVDLDFDDFATVVFPLFTLLDFMVLPLTVLPLPYLA